ncbi:hypothetical protein BD408DRAFT_99256 [Parasitella parasitica]|nr:hypothetical protein BD408DRAFT_99256 [Parasitella parasitica]
MLPKTFFLLTAIVSIATALSSTSIPESLEKKGIDYHKIGCKCLMPFLDEQNRDSSKCKCVERKNGKSIDYYKCEVYVGIVFDFCKDATDKADLYGRCVAHYCNTESSTKPPANIFTF